MRTTRSLSALVVLLSLGIAPRLASAFCGFYVAGDDHELYNNATMVTLLRDGTTTVMSMRNNYQGPPEEFAMVVPVPEVLHKEDVKTLPASIFERLDRLAAPRLVEYWEQDPCPQPVNEDEGAIGTGNYGTIGRGGGTGSGYGAGGRPAVVVEAQFAVGEYDIVILGAEDAMALEQWLTEKGYKIPDGAAAYLRPYVEKGSKFFVAKVDPKKVSFKNGMAQLSPLRFHFKSKSFSLPVRLGLINAKGPQDLLVHILAKNQRYQVANYPNVTIPTNLIVDDSVRERFGEFYAALFDATAEKNPSAVVTEYAWNAGTCDPCPESPLTLEELLTLGLDIVEGHPGKDQPGSTTPAVTAARLVPQVRMGPPKVEGPLDVNIIRRYLRRNMARNRFCYEKELALRPKLKGSVDIDFRIGGDGSVDRVRARGMDRKVAGCLQQGVASMQLPKPKGGKEVKVHYQLSFDSAPGRSNRFSQRGTGLGWGTSSSGWVLTRLHARYDRKSLGNDLEFTAADPIEGGRGGASDDMKQSGDPSSINNFQGRYIIRHEWTGAIECESPQRGVWGGPPATVNASTTPTPALDLAFARRGTLDLRSMLRRPALALVAPSTADAPPAAAPEAPTAADDEPASAEPEDHSSKSSSKGCSTTGAGGESSAALLFLALLWCRRRSQHSFAPLPKTLRPSQSP